MQQAAETAARCLPWSMVRLLAAALGLQGSPEMCTALSTLMLSETYGCVVRFDSRTEANDAVIWPTPGISIRDEVCGRSHK